MSNSRSHRSSGLNLLVDLLDVLHGNTAHSNALATRKEEVTKFLSTITDSLVYTAQAFHLCSESSIDKAGSLYISNDSFIDRTKLVPGFAEYKTGYVWSGASFIDAVSAIANSPNVSPILKRTFSNALPYFSPIKYKTTSAGVPPPSKVRPSDAGSDLHLVKLLEEKSTNDLKYYTTGVSFEPNANTWLMLVARSSLAKTGWALANSVGVIDPGYRGEVIVALRRVDPNAKDLELPYKAVQIIPMQLNFHTMEAVEEVTSTSRGDTGGLGSGQFVEKKTE